MTPPDKFFSVEDTAGAGRAWVRPTWARRCQWRLETAAYAGLEMVLGSIPLALVARVGRWAGAVAHGLLGARRRIVRRNLRIACAGEKTAEEIDALTAEVFRRSGANLLCSMCTARLGERELERALVVRDEAVFRGALARGKGVVMVLAHMGNWEALAQWFPRLLPEGVAGATVYRPLNNPFMNARVAAQRKRLGIGLFSKDDNPLGMASFLRRGGVLGVLSDQRASNAGELVPFFGRLTSCTPIPAILARRTGAAVVGISLRSIGAGRWELRFHASGEGEPSTWSVMELLERMLSVSMADVFWLQDRWKVDRRLPQLVAGKAARGTVPAPTKRRRALRWASADGSVAAAPADASGDFVFEVAGSGAGATWVRGADESELGFLSRVDGAGALPVDFVVGGGEAVRLACRKLGFGWVPEKGEGA